MGLPRSTLQGGDVSPWTGARRWKPGFRTWLAVLLGLMALQAGGDGQSTSLRTSRLRLMDSNQLLQNTNPNDAMAAFRVWVETMGRSRGYALKVEAEIFDRLEELDKRLQTKTVDVVIRTSIDYLRTAPEGLLEAVFSYSRKTKNLFDDYVLVTRRDWKFADITALRGKSLTLFKIGSGLGRLWLDVTLGERGLGPVEQFFGSGTETFKASSVVLPVFFGKSDAGLVIRDSLDTMSKMNPQLAVKLQVLDHSPILCEGVVCLVSGFTTFREELMDGLASLHRDPQGKQLLLVFKVEQLVPFKPQYLDTVHDLQARWAKVKGHPSVSRDSPAAAPPPGKDKKAT